LDTKDATFVQDNLATIIEQIKNYEPEAGKADAGENINDLKNGYANVLNDYITNPEHYTNDLLMTYIDYLDTTNMNIL
jgi:protein-tyrosine phosphatase